MSSSNPVTGSAGRLIELTTEECMIRLEHGHLGRLSLCEASGPVVLPMNYALLGGDVFVRTASGSVLGAAARGDTVAFEIDGFDPLYHGGWDVVLRGPAVEVTAPDELALVSHLPLVPWAGAGHDRVVRIHRRDVSGRRITIPPT